MPVALGWLGWDLPGVLLPAWSLRSWSRTGQQGRGGHQWGFAELFGGSLQGKIMSPLSLLAFVLAQSHAMTQWQGWEESPGLPTLLGNASGGWSRRCGGNTGTFSPPCAPSVALPAAGAASCAALQPAWGGTASSRGCQHAEQHPQLPAHLSSSVLCPGTAQGGSRLQLGHRRRSDGEQRARGGHRTENQAHS